MGGARGRGRRRAGTAGLRAPDPERRYITNYTHNMSYELLNIHAYIGTYIYIYIYIHMYIYIYILCMYMYIYIYIYIHIHIHITYDYLFDV